jgi:hypothetical protein
MLGKFFHIPKPKQFNIKPRYYDPLKEEREARERRIKEELGIVDENENNRSSFYSNIKGQFRNSPKHKSKTVSQARKASNKRLILLILILLLLAYLLFF